MYLKGEGVGQNDESAAEWVYKAAHQGYRPAQRELAFMYFDGVGVDKDYSEAYYWAGLAAEQGDEMANDLAITIEGIVLYPFLITVMHGLQNKLLIV